MKAPELSQLLDKFLRQRAALPEIDVPEPASEVVLFQAAGVHLIDPVAAFEEAVEAAAYLCDGSRPAADDPTKQKAPPEWAALARGHESGVALAFCLGHFPQMIRSLTPLLSETDLARLKPQPGRPWSLEGTLERGQKAVADGRPVEALFAAALLRTAQQFHECAELLQLIRQSNPVGLNDMIANEEAALAWQRGDHDRAAELWARHPRQDSPVVQFNRGLAALFVNDRESARELFGQAAAALPESSAWHHLAKLYLTLGRQATV